MPQSVDSQRSELVDGSTLLPCRALNFLTLLTFLGRTQNALGYRDLISRESHLPGCTTASRIFAIGFVKLTEWDGPGLVFVDLWNAAFVEWRAIGPCEWINIQRSITFRPNDTAEVIVLYRPSLRCQCKKDECCRND